MPGPGFRIARRAGPRLWRGLKGAARSRPAKIAAVGTGAGAGVYAGGKLAKPGIESLGEGGHNAIRGLITGKAQPQGGSKPGEGDNGGGGGQGFTGLIVIVGIFAVLFAFATSGRGKGRRRR